MKDIASDSLEAIAIVGSSCRLPGGSHSPSKLWDLLKSPIDLVAEIQQNRFNAAGFYHPKAEHAGTSNVTKAYLLEDDPWTFDNEFFKISAREAESMDPQQRITLEIVYEAIECAGYSLSQLRGSSTGVFVGQMSDDYRDIVLRDLDCHPQYAGTGIARSILANRVSYVFDWKGPSISIDTACSSSLVALHLAVQSLRSGECNMAVVIGVNSILSPEVFSFLSSLRMISPNGRSRMWDIHADGYARGEGYAAVVIKTLERAIDDYDDIESIIRNTGVNQDGRSTGLTVPNAVSQAELIDLTYAKCGLNCKIEEDRCQYFEAHGTGTPAGDPKEAEAINAAFFPTSHQGAPNNLITTERLKNEKILVGSIKTVIGHLEGAAGLASVLKVSLAIQNGMIPPNLHFDKLNPAIEPYYGGLEVSKNLQQWQKLPAGVPRRASVNSFGFGGTNAHAIIESWDNESSSTKPSSKSFCWGPFVVSANSHTALEATIVSLCEVLKSQTDIDLHRLAWTLQARRTHLTYRASFAAVDKEELITSLESAIKGKKQYPIATRVLKASETHILGVFTGQGAQWVSMGIELFLHSASFRRTIESLESALEAIANGLNWSLTKELMKKTNPERYLSAEISQPLCTAIQIALVDLLKVSGITFSAVVGHSSGEIAAAYSAGVLTATDAILIAYYRGYHTHQSKVAGSNCGKMMAVGMTPEDAAEFCLRKSFLGRINVAAINSPSSITLSGDSNAVDEAKEILDEKAIFARILKVDTAYHSHHMECVREPYIESLQKANIRPKRNTFKGSCNWYSSVYNRNDDHSMSFNVPFEHTYWADNMTRPVFFSSAVISAIKKENLNLVLEIGPHPALKGPTTECIEVASDTQLPYHGVLERGKNSVNTFSNALGFVWRSIDSSTLSVDFKAFQKSCNGPDWTIPRVHKGLSSYPWDHNKPMLKESKKSKVWRTRSTPFHELLGYPSSNGDVREVRWRNILRLADVEWLQGHQFQHQVLFPAAAYLVMAVQAALHLFEHVKQPFQLVELQDVVIHNALTLEGGSSGTETNLVIRVVEESSSGGLAEFYCRSNNADTGLPDFDKKNFTGRVFVKFDAPTEDTLPGRLIPSLPMTDVNTDRFYSWMSKIGLQYTRPFVLNSIKRRFNLSTVTAAGSMNCGYPIHPATFDSVLQGLFAAFSYPGDGRLWTTYLPKSFRRVRFDIYKCQQTNYAANLRLVADCFVTKSSARNICGDIDVFRQYDGQALIQVQGVVFDSLDVPSPANDQCMYWNTIWKRESFSQVESTKQDITQTKIMDDCNLHEICERTSYFYLNQLYKEIGQEQVALLEGHMKEFMDFILKYVHPEKRSAPNSCWNKQWESDTLESVKELGEKGYGDQIDLKLIHLLGSRLPFILQKSESISQVLKDDNMLATLYSEGLGVVETNHYLGAFIDHLVHQFPRMRFLEIGAGTGGSTSVALRHLKSGPEEYTFTDLSPSCFEAAQARFPEHKQLMKFKTLDIDQSPTEQGFQANSYDVIIAAHVFQATKSVSEALKHCRQLLRPGGYLILLEPVNQTRLRIPFLLSTSSLRWLNCETGRSKGPIITEAQWNLLLLENDFSGVDHTLRDFEANSMHTCSFMISQAVDDQIRVLRDPLNRAGGVVLIKKLLVIGGRSLTVSKLRAKIKPLLGSFVEHIEMIDNLEDVQGNGENLGSAVVCLSGLEEATFATMNRQRVSAMQSLFREAKYIIWATRGCRADDPYANIDVGIGRSVLREMPHLRLKLVDIDTIHLEKNRHDAIMLSEMLLQMICLDMPSYNNILWGNETEVAVEDGAVLIPRVVRDNISNDRFNASRRNITRTAAPHMTNPLVISTGEEGVTINEIESNLEDPRLIPSSIQVLSSSLFSIFCSDDERPFYLSMGNSISTEEMVLAISDKNGSIIKNPDYTFICKGSSNPDEMLLAILTVIIYESLFSSINGAIWFHNVDDSTTEIIDTIANRKDASVFLTTSNSASKLVPAGRATYIHPRITERELIQLIPYNLKRFVDMGSNSDDLTELIRSISGGKFNFYRNFHHLSLDQHISLLFNKSSLVNLLADHCSRPELLCDVGWLGENNIIKVGLLHEQQGAARATSIISWTGVESVHVQVAPVTHSRLFTDQKTYFLIGLAGEVGLSLCEWMINCGARYVAIASRNPTVPPEVRKVFEKQGAVVRIFSMDVADMESLTKVHHEIVSSMPPIAGVANGALVVRDHPFDAISFEDLEAVFKPKVVGTQNLDNLFFSTPLDFFILFSSIATVVGKPGQSSYVAANLFMSALAAQRRKRGLAASVMHFGMLLGFGFIHGQTGSLLEARFRQEDCWAIPEPDFHAIFAQAILSGRPENNLDHEIIAGLGTEIKTPWRSISRFSHCRVIGHTSIGNRHYDNEQSTQSIQDRLRQSRDVKEVYGVLKTAIAGRVSLALSCPIESVGEHVGLISLGLDSLLAVEIRSWIFKILEVDLPVLKLLGGSSLSDICHSVLDKLPTSLKSWVEDNEKPQDEPNHGSTDQSTRSSQDSQPELTLSDRDSFEEPKQEGLFGKISTEELAVPSHTFSRNTQSDKKGDQQSQAEYERVGDMSESQAQLYFLHEYLQNNAYNVAYFGRFHGHLDVQKLSWALRLVSKRHEALRSAYFIDISIGRPVQAVLPEPNFTLVHEATHGDEKFQTEIERVKEMKFDIENGVVMKITVVSHSPSLHSIIFNHHHIALDGVSWGIFIAELAQTYSADPNSIPKSISVQQPIDMVKRQLSVLAMNNEKHQADMAFWRKAYRSRPTQLPLFPFAKVKSRPSIKEYDYRINSSHFGLSHEMTKLIEKVALKIGVTPFHFYFASFATFLARCLGVSDVAIGVVNANRTDDENMETIGYFLNMLPVYISLEASEQFEMIAKRSRDAVATVFSHPHTPNDIVDQQSLFQVAINYRKSSVSRTSFGNDGEIEWEGGVTAGSPYDLLLNVAAMPDWTYISLITQQSIYTAADGALLLKWYTRALEAVVRDPSFEISKCPISNESDTAEAIELGRGSKIEALWQGTLLDQIDKIAAKFSNDLAIIDEQAQNLTYAQMSARTIQIMRRLQAITPPLKVGSRVAMLLDPVADAVCCILAIMRLGYVWIPLDTRNHHQRLHAVVDESRPQVLVCHGGTKELAHQISTELDFITLSIDDSDDVYNTKENNISVPEDISSASFNHKDQAAMILYTSGSTGVPKGVVLTNEGLLNQINGTTSTLRLQREITLQQSPLGFDLMLDQIFLALCNGGTIVMVNKSARGDPTQIADLIVRHGVTLTHFVPSEYILLLNYGYHILKNADSWRYAMPGGEKLSQVLRRAFYKLNCSGLQLVNVYGPAEITLACARGFVPYREFNGLQDSQDYLRPSPNYDIEITDTDMSVLPVGFPGEICISGQGVGLGYLERPEETSRKFTRKKSRSSPSSPSSPPSTIRVYRSGDKGRMLPDGTLEVFGRIDGDSQVKIHGFRVELDEIANAIIHTSNGAIVSAAVSWRPSQSSGILVAFVVFDISFDENKSEFIEWLQSSLPLPQVMKPNAIVPTKLIPITSNGKTDRAAVDKISVSDPSNLNTTKKPTRILNRWENSIKEIWEEVLSSRVAHNFERSQSRIDHNSDFFQVGGSSILMIKLKYLLEMQLGVKISMPELFHTSSLSSMANLVADAKAAVNGTDFSPTIPSFLGPKNIAQEIDWDIDIATIVDKLPQPRAIPSLSIKSSPSDSEKLVVVLTGATGFIGKRLLSCLVQSPKVGQVHCIAIRPDASGKPRHVAVNSDKIVEYTGDLSDSNLGLSAAQFKFLAEHSHIIIHNGADVSLLKTYQSLRHANVISTRTLCSMAILRRLPVHYVSTASVAKVIQQKPLLEVPASPADADLLNSVDGYAASKWASEALLAKIAVESGMPVYIHRLAHVMGEDASELDAVGMMTKYSFLLHALPRIKEEAIEGQWDFVIVESVVDELVRSAMKSAIDYGHPSTPQLKREGNRPAVFINHCNDVTIPHCELKEYLETTFGERLGEIELKEWLQLARERGIHPLIYEFFLAFEEGRGKMKLPMMSKTQRVIR